MVYAKKSLGQHFLKNEGILSKIVDAGNVQADDVVLEIGPGQGALTKHLLAKGATVVAVEKDHELFSELQKTFSKEIKNKKLILKEEDILETDISKLLVPSYKLLANIPYNITGAIFKKFLSANFQPETMIVLIQEEVADRIVAREGKESILSLSVKAYGTPKKLFKVSPGSFSPPPKVTSAVLEVKNISKSSFKNKKEEERFFEIVKAGFAHKRKKLSSNLKGLFSSPARGEVPSPRGGGEGDKRAEDLRLEDWLSLAKMKA